MTNAQRLLSIQEGGAQRTWLAENAPAFDAALVDALYAECLARRNIDPHESLKIAQVIELAADVWQDAWTQATAKHVLADAHRFLDRHAEAVAYFEAASAEFRALNNPHRAAQVEVGWVDSLIYLGDYETAQTIGERSKIVLQTANDIVGQGRLLCNLGILAYRRGRLQEADANFAAARPLVEQANEPDIVAMVRGNHANIQIELDQFEAAQRNLNAARAVFALAGATQAVARVDANIAYLLFAQGEYQQALDQFEQSRPYFETSNHPFELITVGLHRSEIYLALNLWDEALRTVSDARKLLSDMRQLPWEVGRLWLNEAVALARTHAVYQPALEAARKIFATEDNRYWLAIADLYEAIFAWRVEDGETAKAKGQAAAAEFRTLGATTRAASCEILLGDIALEEQNILAAVEHFNGARALLGDTSPPALTYAIYYGLGRIDVLNNEPQSALVLLRRALDEIEGLHGTITLEDFKIAYLADKMQVYETVVQLCLTMDTPESLEEAFATVERAKSRALLERMAQNDRDDILLESDNLADQMQRLRRDLNWHYNKLNNPSDGSVRSPRYLATLSDSVNQREEQLRGFLQRLRSPKLEEKRSSLWTVTVKHLQEVLPNGTLLLEYYTLSDQIIVFGIANDAVWRVSLAASSVEINELLSQLRFQMNKFNYGARYRQRHAASLQRSCEDVLSNLYRRLIKPLDGLISAEKLVIVPHNVLHYVPFHALFDGESYLIDQHTVSYAPSATLLSETLRAKQRQATSTPRIIGLDDTTIPYAQDEACAIAELFSDAELFVGKDANIENVTNSHTRPAFLHLATHALFRSDNAAFSSLKLEDGWLSVHDIYAMQHIPDLVTLSACETGRNQVLRGDELIGLCRGFFATGAKSLVVSLWMVEDESAAQLMTKFYENLQQGAAVNDALRQAQVAVRREKPHPYYWAPFVLTGNMNTRIHLN